MMGSNYVPPVAAPEQETYSSVRAFGVSNDVVIPSSATQVGGNYYEWNDNGFIGHGWFVNQTGGPTNHWGFENDAAVNQYLEGLQIAGKAVNLDAVFKNWQEWLLTLDDQTEWDHIKNFENAVYSAGGVACVHA